jgi:histone deacetylase 1/2
VLCVLELLKYHQRVLYVDIDIHHGDGVEEAFYTTNRVMTTSFHQWGDFFPGSGAAEDIGVDEGKYCAVNVPLMRGLDDQAFEQCFKPIIDKIFQTFAPSAVVMCCGADSISGDRIGCWNLSLKGHAGAVAYLKSKGVPVVLLGGGGYTPRNVARCWAYETATAMGVQDAMKDDIPENEMYQSYGPDYRLHLDVDRTLVNKNTRAHLEPLVQRVLENLNRLGGPPSVPFQDVPLDFVSLPDEDEDPIEHTDETKSKKQRVAFPQDTKCNAGEEMLD